MAAKKTRLEVLRYLLSNKHFDNQVDILKDLKAHGMKAIPYMLCRRKFTPVMSHIGNLRFASYKILVS